MLRQKTGGNRFIVSLFLLFMFGMMTGVASLSLENTITKDGQKPILDMAMFAFFIVLGVFSFIKYAGKIVKNQKNREFQI